MNRRTKIVCTLGPATDSPERIRDLIDAGMNVARLNCSHGDWESKRRQIGWIREASPEVAPVGILADLQGPKFRIDEVEDGAIELHVGESVTIGPGMEVPLSDEHIMSKMAPGDRALFGDGSIAMLIKEPVESGFSAEITDGGTLKSKQGITLSGKSFDVPALTEKDREDVVEAIKANVDFIALSYVTGATDMRELRRLVGKEAPDIRLVAKLETREALEDMDDIVAASDAIMVARGDLGLQMEIDDVPVAQKAIIRKCLTAGKPVITATQMLESMMENARPTRAEASDVANAIIDGTDAVMLSGETAAGKHPIETVRTMARIAIKAEALCDLNRASRSDLPSETEAVASAAVHISGRLDANAIVCTSTSGATPRMVSRFRPDAPILCASWNEKTLAQMSLVWGVVAAKMQQPVNADDAVNLSVDAFLDSGHLDFGDKVVITAGIPVGEPGKTNLILVQNVQ